MSWIMFAVLGMVFTGLGNFLFKLSTNAGQPSLSACIILFLTEFVIGVVLWLTRRPDLAASGPGLAWAFAGSLSLALGILCMITAFGKPESQAGVTTALINTNFALVMLLSVFFLKETLSVKQILGLAAILSGICLLI